MCKGAEAVAKYNGASEREIIYRSIFNQRSYLQRFLPFVHFVSCLCLFLPLYHLAFAACNLNVRRRTRRRNAGQEMRKFRGTDLSRTVSDKLTAPVIIL